MKRNYKTKEYLDIAQKIYKKYPNFSFTTDVIVGFPGETNKEFSETCDFVKKIGFLKIHVFRYSKRNKTLAAKMNEQIEEGIKNTRSTQLKEIGLCLENRFKKGMLGKSEEILFENKAGKYWPGFTKNYLRVKLKSRENLKNVIKEIKISKNNLTI